MCRAAQRATRRRKKTERVELQSVQLARTQIQSVYSLCVYAYVCVYVCIYVYMYISVYLYKYIDVFINEFLYVYMYTCWPRAFKGNVSNESNASTSPSIELD